MKTTLITWFDATYGLGFLKNTLAAFYLGEIKTRRGTRISKKKVDQEELESAFDLHLDNSTRKFPFDRVIVLHVNQEVLHRISTPKKKEDNLYHSSELEHGFTTEDLDAKWRILYKNELSLEEEIAFIKKNFPENAETMRNQLWRRIHRYSFDDQWHWLTKVSNLAPWLPSFSLERVDLTLWEDGIKHLANLEQVARAKANWLTKLKDSNPDHRYFINVSQGNKELHTAWYLLNERGYLPQDTTFLQARLQKEGVDPNRKFRPIDFLQLDKDIFQTLPHPRIYEHTKSPKRQALRLMLQSYLELGFAVLILGPRGTGKTRLVDQYTKKEVEAVSCERLNDEDFFRQQFLGNQKQSGLLKRANGGVLFLDDLHLLERRRQLELLPLLATDKNNKLKNYLSGETKITLVGASNMALTDLRERLHPDFYDRIAQLILDVPPLSEAYEDRESDWEAIWKQLQFPGACPKSPELLRWLRELELPGNFRDLQRIAMSYRAWLTFSPELKKLYPKTGTTFDFAKQEYGKQQSQDKIPAAYPFDRQTSLQKMKADFHQALATWANQELGSDNKAKDHFQALDSNEKVTRSSLTNWRNGKYGKQEKQP